MEDLDFSIPIGKRYKIVRQPLAPFNHYPSQAGRVTRREMQTKNTFNHYYIFRKHIKKTPLTLSLHIWSHVGIFIESLFNGVKYRNPNIVLGTFDGWGYIFRHMKTGKFPDEKPAAHKKSSHEPVTEIIGAD
jgi:hypothetical protein